MRDKCEGMVTDGLLPNPTLSNQTPANSQPTCHRQADQLLHLQWASQTPYGFYLGLPQAVRLASRRAILLKRLSKPALHSRPTHTQRSNLSAPKCGSAMERKKCIKNGGPADCHRQPASPLIIIFSPPADF